jgi:hypothetical protein
VCVAQPDFIRKQGSRLRSPTPSPLMKILFAWPLPIVASGESGRAGMPADYIRFASRFGPNHSPTAPVGAMSDAG